MRVVVSCKPGRRQLAGFVASTPMIWFGVIRLHDSRRIEKMRAAVGDAKR